MIKAGVGPAVLAGVLAFGCAALQYLALEELLTEAHEVQETLWLPGHAVSRVRADLLAL